MFVFQRQCKTVDNAEEKRNDEKRNFDRSCFSPSQNLQKFSNAVVSFSFENKLKKNVENENFFRSILLCKTYC